MIFPAIDLMDGGAQWIHIVDLDGAKHGNAEQSELIINIAKNTKLKIQTGGGIRSLEQIKRLLEGGVERVVIGSLAITNPVMVKFWLSELGPERIVLALDVNIGEDGLPYPATRGWTETTETSLWDILADYSGSGLKTVLVTDIGRDGVMVGSNVELYKELAVQFPSLDIITSGGVGTLEHVKTLKTLNPHGIIIGKALYEGAFTIEDAIKC